MTDRLVTVEKVVVGGKALARDNGFVIFIDGALPGEKVVARITLRKKKFAIARIEEILEASSCRREPYCPVFGKCGGCSALHVNYEAQLLLKQEILREALKTVPGGWKKIEPIWGMEQPCFYRNKMEFTFGLNAGQITLGLHRKGDFRSVVLTDQCLLQSPQSNEILKRTLEFARNRGLSAFDKKSQSGMLRHLTIREGKNTSQRMVHLFATQLHPSFQDLAEELQDLTTTFVVSLNRSLADAAQTDRMWVLRGSGIIQEQINGYLFNILPHTFFQTNTVQAEKMFAAIRDWANAIEPRLALDLYAGIGPIGFHLSSVAKKVLAVEANSAAAAIAEQNLKLNGIRNVSMLCGQVEKGLPSVEKEKLDLVVIDPPRTGLHKKALAKVLALSPPCIFYVSCNPATLARDLNIFWQSGYEIKKIQPIDMFPHTFHIETLVHLKRTA